MSVRDKLLLLALIGLGIVTVAALLATFDVVEELVVVLPLLALGFFTTLRSIGWLSVERDFSIPDSPFVTTHESAGDWDAESYLTGDGQRVYGLRFCRDNNEFAWQGLIEADVRQLHELTGEILQD